MISEIDWSKEGDERRMMFESAVADCVDHINDFVRLFDILRYSGSFVLRERVGEPSARDEADRMWGRLSHREKK